MTKSATMEATGPKLGDTHTVKVRGKDVTLTFSEGDIWTDPEGARRDPADGKLVETKGEAFVRIAKRRTINAMDSIKMLEPLSSPTNYEYTEAQWQKIVNTLRKNVDDLEAIFKAGGKAVAVSDFEL